MEPPALQPLDSVVEFVLLQLQVLLEMLSAVALEKLCFKIIYLMRLSGIPCTLLN